jgi:hypothetical protein
MFTLKADIPPQAPCSAPGNCCRPTIAAVVIRCVAGWRCHAEGIRRQADERIDLIGGSAIAAIN